MATRLNVDGELVRQLVRQKKLDETNRIRRQGGQIAVALARKIMSYQSDTFNGRSVSLSLAGKMAIRMLRDAAEIRDGVQLTNYVGEVRR